MRQAKRKGEKCQRKERNIKIKKIRIQTMTCLDKLHIYTFTTRPIQKGITFYQGQKLILICCQISCDCKLSVELATYQSGLFRFAQHVPNLRHQIPNDVRTAYRLDRQKRSILMHFPTLLFWPGRYARSTLLTVQMVARRPHSLVRIGFKIYNVMCPYASNALFFLTLY